MVREYEEINELVVSRLLTDPYNLKILCATYRTPRSARQLAYMFDIPIATCYRKLRELERAQLISCVDRPLSPQGRRYSRYRSELEGMTVQFEKGKLRIRLQLAYRMPMEIVETAETLMSKSTS